MSNACRLTDRKRTLIFLNIMISCIASSMLATALTTALPPIIQDLHVSVSTGQWLTSGYQIPYSQALPCRTWDFYDRASYLRCRA